MPHAAIVRPYRWLAQYYDEVFASMRSRPTRPVSALALVRVCNKRGAAEQRIKE
jgi:hypothetical protein